MNANDRSVPISRYWFACYYPDKQSNDGMTCLGSFFSIAELQREARIPNGVAAPVAVELHD